MSNDPQNGRQKASDDSRHRDAGQERGQGEADSLEPPVTTQDRASGVGSTEPATQYAAFAELYDRWFPFVRAESRRYVLVDADAEDAAQEVFQRLWSNGRWRAIRSSRAYFRSAAQYSALKYRARRNREISADDLEFGRLLPSHAAPDVLRARRRRIKLLLRLFQDFPPRCAQVMARVYINGLSRRMTAEELGMSLAAVEKQITRGRQLLRERVRTKLGQEWLSTFEDGGGRRFRGSTVTTSRGSPY